ncbi:Uncharacterised protein [Vibrio cholerae]|nr:Uncharacterised protein [Vibrio cholerae]
MCSCPESSTLITRIAGALYGFANTFTSSPAIRCGM